MKWIIVSIIAVVLQQFLPWWSIVFAGFIFGFLIEQSARAAFIYGYLGIFLLWGGAALFIYIVNDAILAQRLASLMGLPHGILVVIITGIAGGVISGLSALSANYLQQMIKWHPWRVREE